MKKQITLKQFIINNLRKSTWKWGPRNRVKQKAKIARNQYTCEKCLGIFPNKDVKLDHRFPVVDPKIGWIDFNTYIERMFCNEEGFSLLCTNCHNEKTKLENEIRKQNKQK